MAPKYLGYWSSTGGFQDKNHYLIVSWTIYISEWRRKGEIALSNYSKVIRISSHIEHQILRIDLEKTLQCVRKVAVQGKLH